MTPTEPAIALAMSTLGLDRMQAVRHLQSRELAKGLAQRNRAALTAQRDAEGDGRLDSPPAPSATPIDENSKKRGDIVYTPAWCAVDMVEHFKPSGKILEPCRGDGAILSLLPPGSLWCEIEEGRDFYDFRDAVDWVFTNPPYSKTRPFFNHAATLADNIVFLVPARNIVSGYGFVRDARAYGGTAEIRWYGTGNKLGFPMGNAIAAFHWQRDYDGPTKQSFYWGDK